MRRWLSRGFVGFAVSLAAPVSAGAALGPNDVIRSFSDLGSIEPAATNQSLLPQFRAGLCPRGRARRPVGRLGIATKSAVKLVRRGKGRKAFAKLLKRKASASEGFAVAGLAKGNAGAALAGFLAAHRKEPKNALHLVNVSVMLAQAGKPAEAVAMAKAALKARRPAKGALGLSTRALALNAQGFALFHLKRYAEAARVLRRAAAAEPLLREAKLNLAAALLCTGRMSEALTAYEAGQRRNRFSGGAAALREITRPDGTRIAHPEGVLDLSQGQAGTLPPVTLPRTPADAAAARSTFKQQSDQRYRQSTDLQDEYHALFAASLAQAGSNPQSFNRAAQIHLYYAEWRLFYPELARLLDDELTTYSNQVAAMVTAFTEYHRQVAESCSGETTSAGNHQCRYEQCGPALAARHNEWLAIAQAQDAAVRKWAAGLHEYGTGLAANLSDPASHRQMMTRLLFEIYGFYDALYLDQIETWTVTADSYKSDCIEEPGTGEGETGPESLPPSLACPEALKFVSFNLSLPLPEGLKLDLTLKCEAVTVGVSSLLPLTPFAEIEFKFKGAQTTIFAGGRGSAGALGADGGVYVSFDSSGTLKDIGIKGSTTASGSAGPVQLGGSGFEGDISLAPYLL